MQDYRKLLVWQKAHELALLTYRLTANFPREETFGLRNSLRKTSVDIPAGIADGCGRTNDTEFTRSIGGSVSLANRLEYYALLSLDLGMLNTTDHDLLANRVVEVRKMLSGLSSRLTH